MNDKQFKQTNNNTKDCTVFNERNLKDMKVKTFKRLGTVQNKNQLPKTNLKLLKFIEQNEDKFVFQDLLYIDPLKKIYKKIKKKNHYTRYPTINL